MQSKRKSRPHQTTLNRFWKSQRIQLSNQSRQEEIPAAANIGGLSLHLDFISAQEEIELLQAVGAQEWNTTLARRTQHYGYEYGYADKIISIVEPLPAWSAVVVDRLLELGILKVRPDQMIVNEYLPGQGIHPHVDDVNAFGDGIVSVSLESSIIMDFTQQTEPYTKCEVLLPSRSALVLTGDARYKWKHGIVKRKWDGEVPRGRRVSLTFRKVL